MEKEKKIRKKKVEKTEKPEKKKSVKKSKLNYGVVERKVTIYFDDSHSEFSL